MAQLSWCIPKVAAAVRATVGGGAQHLRHAASWLFVFPCLQGQTADEAAAAPSSVTHDSSTAKQPVADNGAVRLTEEWKRLVTDRLIRLLCDLHQVTVLGYLGPEPVSWCTAISMRSHKATTVKVELMPVRTGGGLIQSSSKLGHWYQHLVCV